MGKGIGNNGVDEKLEREWE